MSERKVVTIDKIDQKILSVLLTNARISTAELAKVIKNNYPVVRNRLNRLVEKGVIRFFHPILQYPGIGIRRYYGVYLSIKSPSDEHLENLLKEFVANPYIIKVYELEGRWNVFLLVTTNYIKEARNVLNEIRQSCRGHLISFSIMATYTISYLNRQFFLSETFDVPHDSISSGYRPVIQENPLVHLGKPVDLDETDFKVLNFLKLNARATLEGIGEGAGLEAQLVDYRLRKYLRSKLITYFGIDVDPASLGYTEYLLCLNVEGDAEVKDKIYTHLNTVKEAYHFFEYLGYWELVITFCVKERQRVHEIRAEILKICGKSIEDYDIVLVKKRLKTDPYPDVDLVYPKK